jgi:hypothetical protein
MRIVVDARTDVDRAGALSYPGLMRTSSMTGVKLYEKRMQSAWARGLAACLLAAGAIGLGGCTRESVRIALAAQRRADQVQQALFDRQHEALCALLYRDLQHRLEQSGAALTAAQGSALNEAWNDRDLVEFWAVQHERAKALRLIGVDAKLYSAQSVIDLLYKMLSAKVDRVEQGLAAQVGQRAAEKASTESGANDD